MWTKKKIILWTSLLSIGLMGVGILFALRMGSASGGKVRPSAETDMVLDALLESLLANVKINPDAASHGELGLAYEANERLEEAASYYERAIGLDPEDWRWRFHLGVVLAERGELEQALEQWQKIAVTDSTLAPVQQRIGNAALELGRFDLARTAYQALIALRPGLAQGYLGLADVLVQQGQAADAEAMLVQALQLNPRSRLGHYLLGTAYQRLGRQAEAERALQRGLGAVYEMLPDPLTKKLQAYVVLPDKLIRTAQGYARMGDLRQATSLLEQAYRLYPDRSDVLNNLAVVYMDQGRLEAARPLLSKARFTDANSEETLLNLALLEAQSGDPYAALAYTDTATTMAPQSDAANLAKAQALMRLGRREEALATAHSSLTVGPSNPRIYGMIGDLNFQIGHHAEAVDYLNRALALDPYLIPARVRLAQAYWALNDKEAARHALSDARRIAPKDPLISQVEQLFLEDHEQ